MRSLGLALTLGLSLLAGRAAEAQRLLLPVPDPELDVDVVFGTPVGPVPAWVDPATEGALGGRELRAVRGPGHDAKRLVAFAVCSELDVLDRFRHAPLRQPHQ